LVAEKLKATENRQLTTDNRHLRTEALMTTDTTVLITDMAILVGIFLLGFLAKIFPRNGKNDGSKH
jgi:hypothetical protein